MSRKPTLVSCLDVVRKQTRILIKPVLAGDRLPSASLSLALMVCSASEREAYAFLCAVCARYDALMRVDGPNSKTSACIAQYGEAKAAIAQFERNLNAEG